MNYIKNLRFHSLDEYRCHYKSILCKYKDDCRIKNDCYFYHSDEDYNSPCCFYYFRENKNKKDCYTPCKFGKDCKLSHKRNVPFIPETLKEIILQICGDKKIEKEREFLREREREIEKQEENERKRQREYEVEIEYQNKKRREQYEYEKKEHDLKVFFNHNTALCNENQALIKKCKDYEIIVQTFITKINQQHAIIQEREKVLAQKELELQTYKLLLSQSKK